MISLSFSIIVICNWICWFVLRVVPNCDFIPNAIFWSISFPCFFNESQSLRFWANEVNQTIITKIKTTFINRVVIRII